MTDCGLSRGWSYMLFIKNGQERKGWKDSQRLLSRYRITYFYTCKYRRKNVTLLR